MKKETIILLIMLALVFFTGCNGEESRSKKTITIGAAASLTNPLNEIIESFKKDNPDYDILLTFASSGSLVKQIKEGAPVDIFLSASTGQFDELIGEKISSENSRILLSNSMTLITYDDKIFKNGEDQSNYSNFTSYTYSIGDPDSVPAGKYAYEALHNLGFWTENNENQITAKSVRQVLNYVESKNVEYGIVYSSDAYNNEKIRVLKTFDTSMHSPINYPIGILDDSLDNETKLVYDYIISDKGINIFLAHGFKKSNLKDGEEVSDQ